MNRLCAFGLVAILAIGAAGCVTGNGAVDSFTVGQNSLDVARSGYAAALKAELAYVAEPLCAAGAHWTVAKPCSELTVVRKLQAADRLVNADFKTVQAMIDAKNNVGLDAAITSLKLAISNFEALGQL